MKQIVIIVPCYNEEASLPHLAQALQKLRQKLVSKYAMDILFVNDGSYDDTQRIIDQLCGSHRYMYYRQLDQNVGQQSALRAGINAALSYDAAIMMDADMQHPPALIPNMLKAWEQGNKIVQMVRRDSLKEVGFIKYLTSKSYYFFFNRISDFRLEYGASDFRLIDRVVVEAVESSPEKHLFLRGFFSWLNVTKTQIEYKPGKRVAGVSNYSFGKMFNLGQSGILQFGEKPLQMAMRLGVFTAFVSFLYGLILIIGYYFGNYVVSGWTSLMVVVLFCFGVNFILLGIIGSYLAHSIRITKQRPEYVIAKEKSPNHLWARVGDAYTKLHSTNG